MGYSFIPSNQESISDKNTRSVYNWVMSKQDSIDIKHRVNNPLAINLSNNKIKLHRSLKNHISIKDIKNKYFCYISYGNGTRDKKGLNSDGIIFEKLLVEDLINYKYYGVSYSFKYENYIKNLHDSKLSSYKDINITHCGQLNQKRPLMIINDNFYIMDKIKDIGKIVSDITINSNNKKDINLSLKLGSGTKLFNLGIAKYLNRFEMQSGKILNINGKNLLNLFGINEEYFLRVFSEYGKEEFLKQRLIEDVSAFVNFRKIHSFLSSGVGYGYSLLSVMNIEDKEIKSNNFNSKQDVVKMTKPISISIEYPIGFTKRVIIRINCLSVDFELEFRNQSGDIYPNVLMGKCKLK